MRGEKLTGTTSLHSGGNVPGPAAGSNGDVGANGTNQVQVGRDTVAQVNGIDGLDSVVQDGPVMLICK